MSFDIETKNDNLSDGELVKSISAGNYTHLQTLINRYMPYIISVASRYNSSGYDVEDLIEEGIIAVFDAVKSFDGDKSSFRTFVTLCINRAISGQVKMLSSKKRIPERLITNIDEAVLPDESSPENIFIEKESYNDLAVAIKNNLSDFEYKVFSAFMQGDSYVDIASSLNITVKSVDNALRRIRSKLRR